MADLSLTHEGNGYLTLRIGDSVTISVDPVYTVIDRGQRYKVRELPRTDFVLLTESHPDLLEDALDILEAGEATLVADPVVCDAAARELGLPADRFMDLEAYERASCASFRVTAFPIDLPASRGGSLLSALPTPPLLAESGAQMLSGEPMRMMRNLPMFGQLTSMLMQQSMGPARRDGLGYIIEVTGGPTVALLSSSLVGPADLDMLEDLADLAHPDLVAAAVSGDATEGLVWASRVLEPETFVLYRREDPYAPGAARGNLPMARFIDALEEDDENVQVEHLREGDRFVLEARQKTPQPTPMAPSKGSSKKAG